MSDPRQPGPKFDPFQQQHPSAQRGPSGYVYPTLPPAQKPPKRRHPIRRVVLWSAAGILAVVVIATAASGGSDTTSAARATSSPAATEAVTVPVPPVDVAAPEDEATEDAPPAPPAPRVLLDLAGNGINNTKQFAVGGPWTLKYSFDCSGFSLGRGNFIVTIAGSDGLPVAFPVNALDASGQSESQVYDTGTLHLEINSECDWHVIVVG